MVQQECGHEEKHISILHNIFMNFYHTPSFLKTQNSVYTKIKIGYFLESRKGWIWCEKTINDKHSLWLKGGERSLRSGLPQWHFGHIQERREKNKIKCSHSSDIFMLRY